MADAQEISKGRCKGPNNEENEYRLTGAIHVSWDRERAWHGEKVKILVRTENVGDGDVKLTIRSVDGKTKVDAVEGISTTDGALEHEYTVDWKEKDPPKDKDAFEIEATLGEDKLKSEPSLPLTVDLVPPALSF